MFSLFIRRSADHFQDDGFSYQERQRRQAAKDANPWVRAWNWYRSIGIPAKILVTTIAVTAAYLTFVFGLIVGTVLRIMAAR